MKIRQATDAFQVDICLENDLQQDPLWGASNMCITCQVTQVYIGLDINMREIEGEIPAEAGGLSNNEADIQAQWRMRVRHSKYERLRLSSEIAK